MCRLSWKGIETRLILRNGVEEGSNIQPTVLSLDPVYGEETLDSLDPLEVREPVVQPPQKCDFLNPEEIAILYVDGGERVRTERCPHSVVLFQQGAVPWEELVRRNIELHSPGHKSEPKGKKSQRDNRYDSVFIGESKQPSHDSAAKIEPSSLFELG